MAALQILRFNLAAGNGEFDAAYRHGSEASAHFRRLGNLRMVALYQAARGECMDVLGQYSEAIALFRSAHEQALRSGSEYVVNICLRKLAISHKRNGNPDQARLSLDVVEKQLSEPYAVLEVAWLLLMDGDFEQVLERIDGLVKRKVEYERVVALKGLQAIYSCALRKLGRVEEALEAALEARRQFAVMPFHSYELESLIRLSHAEALYAIGRHAEAQAVIAKSRERLLQRAQTIGEPAWRESFLYKVPENRRILELAEHWSHSSPDAAAVDVSE